MYEARKTNNSEKRIIRVIVNNVEEAKQIVATDKEVEIVIKENTATANSDVITISNNYGANLVTSDEITLIRFSESNLNQK